VSASIVRRVIAHVKTQNWFAAGIDFLIVVLGVFIGIQVSNWNEARVEERRREQIAEALVTSLRDSIAVQTRFISEVERGLAGWQEAYGRGERPVPFYYRIKGSDSAPDVWSTLEQMHLSELFDPATLFDLAFFYSEQSGVDRKYVRYVTFVEDKLLPELAEGATGFYDERGRLRPEFQANMDRLREYQQETVRLRLWGNCLIYRLNAHKTFTQTCIRAGFRLPGMKAAPDGATNAFSPSSLAWPVNLNR
jgi:hypothetical protein